MCLQPQGILKPYKMDSQGCMLITLDVANKMIKKRTKNCQSNLPHVFSAC